jgi:hypothetical protein
MQEEVNDKTIALSVKTTKLTGTVLKIALQKFLSEMEKQKQKSKTQPKQGKQTMKQLMRKNTQITNIEVTDGNIKSFERIARKYGIDFSLKKDASEQPPKYIIFFKAKDVDVMTAAFKEYTANDLKKTNKPSLRKRLAKAMETVRKHREKVKEKTKDRGLQVL